jgi:hypothetical protein
VAAEIFNFHYLLALPGKARWDVSYGLTFVKQYFKNVTDFYLLQFELGFYEI